VYILEYYSTRRKYEFYSDNVLIVT